MDSNQQQALVSIKRQIRTSAQTDIIDSDLVVAEQAIALVYNGISHAVMMATPTDLLDFALGFSLAEQIITQPSDILDHEIVISEIGIEIQLSISSRLFTALKSKRRSLAGNSGCGLCGVESLQQTVKQHLPLIQNDLVSFNTVKLALAQFQQQQVLNNQAGGVHGAAFCSLSTGQIICLREDVGRHNAHDKLIGALAQNNVELNQGFILVSSRASYEMVDKTIAAGINHLVTMSAATSKAITWAKQHHLNLIGFARDNRQVIYV
ncbi:MAG: formate dehydrogenase accessory sulfurtransferase FdhD [Alteromonadaceae bacterium]|nr:formate dehydrogenase accessory sulfurtransferase FdhD [Alteromonadaceae bacterium]